MSNRNRHIPSARSSANLSSIAGLAIMFANTGTALAQPAGVPVTNLGNFSSEPFFSSFTNMTLTTATPVAWYKIRLQRIADPHRFLDISTSGAGFGDTEIGLYSSTGTLIATDDDDGAQNFSALSFGITNPAAAMRVPPVAAAGQTAGEPNNGRDGTLSGDPLVGPLGTAADYYIAVTRFNAAFGNNFGVIPPSGPVSDFPLLMTIRMNTPGGQVAPTVTGLDVERVLGDSGFTAFAFASGNTSQILLDASSVGAGTAEELFYDAIDDFWRGSGELSPPLQTLGNFALVFRASNAIGDVTIDNAVFTVSPTNFNCGRANQRQIATVPGTTVYTYDTRFADIDGPWTNACFNPAQPPTGNDVWFQMFPTQNGTLTLSTCNSDTGFTGTQPDTLLGIRTGCNTSFTTCGDDVGGCGLGTRLNNIPVTAGQQYNIAVRAWGADIVDGRLAVTFTPTPPSCPVDVGTQGGITGSDGLLNNNDFAAFITLFFNNDARADVGQQGGVPGSDGQFNNNDFAAFITLFFQGCP